MTHDYDSIFEAGPSLPSRRLKPVLSSDADRDGWTAAPTIDVKPAEGQPIPAPSLFEAFADVRHQLQILVAAVARIEAKIG